MYLGIWHLQGSFYRAFALTTLCGVFSSPETWFCRQVVWTL